MTHVPSFEESDPLIVEPVVKKIRFTRKVKKEKLPVALIRKVIRREDLEQLRIERGMLYPALNVREFLIDIKGYTVNQYKEIVKWSAVPEWDKVKNETQSKITARVAQRHVDIIADNEDLFLRTTRLGLTRIVEMLTKLQVSDTPELVKVWDPIKKKHKTFKKNQLRSVDIANLMIALKTGMEIYRKSLGLTEESEGMSHVVDQIRDMMGGDINFTQINLNTGPKAKNIGQEKILDMGENDYDGLFTIIEMKRKAKKLKAIDAETKDVSSN